MQTYQQYPLTHLAQCLDPLATLFIDCDGKTQLVSTVLSLSHLPYRCYLGTVAYEGKHVAPHYWIELVTDGGHRWRVDYALHQWLAHPQHSIPVGLFNPLDFPHLIYQGKTIPPVVLPEPLFLATQFDPRHITILPYAPLLRP